ncbi:MFS general substrate transporter [Trichoderma longibrachiatum ATCC 18648]|uniref:MFS general substrate transporter n=1 Tax=Trichoderma longibrachiatum ATCC 18648 TaxID=983965 RepID=A0A2T4C409_TRILO|nr:MFS general substrate transporter [Trichoderma longibrachiatum ATCC 18648]
MDPSSIRIVGNITRPPSVHSLRSALKTLDIPSMPPTVPLPPIPTSPSSIKSPSSVKSRSATITGVASPRLNTGSIKNKASFTSLAFRPHKPIKYGTGRFSQVELVPQPSDDLKDPLNWPQWRKELNLASLVFMACLIGAMKTALVAVNDVLATHYGVSYTWIAALTATPLMVSALTGSVSSVAAKLVGKRPVYLASAALIFAGCLWNMTADSSYGSSMGARVMQGLGWGAFDTLLMETIQDTFYEHERNTRVSLYTILTITSTWAFPLIGGSVSYKVGPFAPYRIISALFAIAIPMLALTAPETAFDRSRAAIATTPVLNYTFPWEPQPTHVALALNRDSAIDYVREMKPWSFAGEKTVSTSLQAPRALAAPTTTLVFLVTALPHCFLWGLIASLSLLLSPEPFNLPPSILGTLTAGPWILAALLVAGICFYRSAHHKFTRCVSSLTIAGGSLLALIGLLSFGLNVGSFISGPTTSSSSSSLLAPEASHDLNLPLLSLQLGLLAAGASTLEAAARPLLARSASFTASSMAAAQRSIGDMHSWVVILRNLVSGAMVLAVPHAIARPGDGGLRALIIGLGTVQVGVTALVLLLWRFGEESVWRVDGKVMGLVNLRMPHPEESFFDTD